MPPARTAASTSVTDGAAAPARPSARDPVHSSGGRQHSPSLQRCRHARLRPLTLYRPEKATHLEKPVVCIPDFSAQSLSRSLSPLLTTRMHTPVASPAIYTPTSQLKLAKRSCDICRHSHTCTVSIPLRIQGLLLSLCILYQQLLVFHVV